MHYVFFVYDFWFLVDFGVIVDFLGPNGLLLGSVYNSKTVLRSTHVVEQHSFSMFLSILTFDFDLTFGVIFDFLRP